MKRTWRNQFGPEYAVPVEIEREFADTSWGNDSAPSFTFKGRENDEDAPRLWVEHVNPDLRENQGDVRYGVQRAYGEAVYAGDDMAEAVKAFRWLA